METQLVKVRCSLLVLSIVFFGVTNCQRILSNMERSDVFRNKICKNEYAINRKLQLLETSIQELTKSLRESKIEAHVLSEKLEHVVNIQSSGKSIIRRLETPTDSTELSQEINNRRLYQIEGELTELDVKTAKSIREIVKKIDQATTSGNETMNRLDELENTVQEIANRRLDQMEEKLNELDVNTTKSINELINKVEQNVTFTNGTKNQMGQLNDYTTKLINDLTNKVEQTTSLTNGTMNRIDQLENTAREIVNRLDQKEDNLNELDINTTKSICEHVNKVEQTISVTNGTMNGMDQLKNTVLEIVNRRLNQTYGILNELDVNKTKSINELTDKVEQTISVTNETMNRMDQLEKTTRETVNRLDQTESKLNELDTNTTKSICELMSKVEQTKSVTNGTMNRMDLFENTVQGNVNRRLNQTEGKLNELEIKTTKSIYEIMDRVEKIAGFKNGTMDHINQLESTLLELVAVTNESRSERLGERLAQTELKVYELEYTEEDIQRNITYLATRPGGTYVRWGKLLCPATANLVYKGFTAGKTRHIGGSGTNILCLHDNPIAGPLTHDTQSERAQIYGGQIGQNTISLPCAVCRTKTSGTTLMVPGRNLCIAGWNREYSGRLMASQAGVFGGTEYICVDSNQNGGFWSFDQNFRLFDVEARCGALQCPPYVNNQQLACAVCSSKT